MDAAALPTAKSEAPGAETPSTACGDRSGSGSTLGSPRFVARAALALLVANVRYWTTVAPVVRGELRRWERRAQAIENPELRALALEKLHGEGFHAEAAAMLATLAPRAYRRDAVEAIVALELLFDYLDGLTERPSADPLGDGARLFEAYVDAVTVGGSEDVDGFGANPDGRVGKDDSRADDNGYLEALSSAARAALSRLPAADAITASARASALRSAQAQVRMHAVPQLGIEQVRQWASSETDGTGLQWRELLAGSASSVLAVHALIAAAADPATTEDEGEAIERAYLHTCVQLTLLDGLVDHEQDVRMQDAGALGSGGLGYIGLYEDREELARTLTDAATRAAAHARALRHGPHHAMTLVGVVAYYTSAPGARGELAAPIAGRLQHRLEPLMTPTLAVMRAWRRAKRMGNRRKRSIRGLGSLAKGER